MENDKTNYLSRSEGAEGLLFYDNSLAAGANVKKFFPPTEGESPAEYLRRPKVPVPISSSIVDRISNILLQGFVITTSTEESQLVMDETVEELQLSEFTRDMFINTIVTGNNLAVMRILDTSISLENWDGRYVWTNDTLSGYEYTERDDLIVPVLSSDVKEDDRTVVIIDDLIFGGVNHGLPFAPSVLTKNIDKYEDGCGKSFIMRFSDLVLEYNHTISQISKSIKVLQNVWVTNRDIDNPENPIRLSPDRINFLGIDGTLEQAVRNLNLTEERNYLDILEHQISRASQVPAELAGLKDAGKLPSGLALNILLQPLIELIERLRKVFIPSVEELAYKVLALKYILAGKKIPAGLIITVKTNESLFPEDRTQRIGEIILLKKEGIINEKQAQLLLEPVLNLDLGGNV